jgi:hypothetical protein
VLVKNALRLVRHLLGVAPATSKLLRPPGLSAIPTRPTIQTMLRVHCTMAARSLSRAVTTKTTPAGPPMTASVSSRLFLRCQFRTLNTTSARRNTVTSSLPVGSTKDRPASPAASAQTAATPSTIPPKPYNGPLAPTFRRLKLFSLSSLTLSFALTPFLFIIESSLPASARIALAGTALGTSGISTYLVAWCGRPYVATLNRIPSSDNPDAPYILEMTTMTLALRQRVTRVFDTTFLG